MRLSVAIRLGSMLSAQCTGSFTDYAGRTCALGAARAAGYPVVEDPDQGYAIETSDAVYACDIDQCDYFGVKGEIRPTLYRFIAHLNDHHKWTREQIADWVATIEAAQESGQPASERCGTTAVEQPVVTTRG